MDYGGGDLLLAGRMAGCWVIVRGLCVHALGGDLKTAWFSFSDEKRVRGVCDTRRAVQIDVLHLPLPLENKNAEYTTEQQV